MQTGHYMPAFSHVRDMAQPPPGLLVLWYNYYTTTSSYYDRNGDKVSDLPLGQLDPGLADTDFDVDINGYALAPAIFWASNKTILGGARYMAGVVPVYFWANADIALQPMGETSAKISGMADWYFNPLTLSWGYEHMDLTVAYGFTAPVGRYEFGADDNIGLGFWTHQVQSFGYYYPVVDKSTALMLGLTYELNSDMEGADFNPGNRFSLEWGLSQYLSEKLEVSVQGGHNWQATDDRGSDVDYDASIHDKKSTIGFAAGYWVWPGRMQLTGKYTHDFGMRQRFKTNAFMLNLTFVANALTGSKE